MDSLKQPYKWIWLHHQFWEGPTFRYAKKKKKHLQIINYELNQLKLKGNEKNKEKKNYLQKEIHKRTAQMNYVSGGSFVGAKTIEQFSSNRTISLEDMNESLVPNNGKFTFKSNYIKWMRGNT